MKRNKSFAVVCDYSDIDGSVYLFDSLDEAQLALTDFVHECHKYCVNDKRVGSSYDISEDMMRGVVKEHDAFKGVKENRFFIARAYL